MLSMSPDINVETLDRDISCYKKYWNYRHTSQFLHLLLLVNHWQEMTKQRLKTLQLKQGQDMRKQCLQASKQDLHETRIINYHVWTKRY